MADSLHARNEFVCVIVALLAAREYAELERFTGGAWISTSDLKRAVSEYGCTLLPLPEEAKQRIDYIENDNSQPEAWAVNVPLFTAEEGLSDLTLQLTLTEIQANQFRIEIDNLHVL